MRIVVTGGAGFIGSHIVEDLSKEDAHDLLVVDNLSKGVEKNVPKSALLFRGDVTSSATAQVIENFKPDAVIHLAAQMDVMTSVECPAYDANVNVLGTLNVLEAARKGGAQVFATASSGGAVYGDPEALPATELTPAVPLSPYGVSKFCSEQYLALYDRQYGMRTVSLRLANVYGPRQGNGGEAGVVSIFAKAMLQGKTPTMFGDGLQTRDFVCAPDVSRAFRLSLTNERVRGAYNVSVNEQTSLLDLFDDLKELTGFKGAPNFTVGRAGEVRTSQLAFDRLRNDGDWTPKIKLFEGLAMTVSEICESWETTGIRRAA